MLCLNVGAYDASMIQPIGTHQVGRVVSSPTAPLEQRVAVESQSAWQGSDSFQGAFPSDPHTAESGGDPGAALTTPSTPHGGPAAPTTARLEEPAVPADSRSSSCRTAGELDGWLINGTQSAGSPQGPPPRGVGIHSPAPATAPVRGSDPEAEAARQHRLGTDPAVGQYRPGEERTAVRVEQQEGILLERYQPASPSEKGDWYNPVNGMVYDGCSPGPEKYFQRTWDRYMKALEEHLEHPTVDRVVIDVTDLALEGSNLAQLKAHVGGLPEGHQDRIVRVGF